LYNLHHHCITTIVTASLRHQNILTKKQATTQNINLEEDEIQQQNTGSDAGLKRNHNPGHKKVVVCDKENAFVAVVKENQWFEMKEVQVS